LLDPVSDEDGEALGAGSRALDERARNRDARPVADTSDLVTDLWESDDELDAFLADLRVSRGQSLA
jgi:hypothetical protein